MINSKLIKIYISLSNDCKKILRRYLKSSFVTESKDIVSFFTFIDTRREITALSVSKEKAFSYLYPKAVYNDLKIRHLIWKSTEIMEDFLLYYQTQNSLLLRNKILSDFYFSNNLPFLSNMIITEELEKIEQKEERSVLDYQTLYSFGLKYYDINSNNNRTSDFKFEQTCNALNVDIIVEVLKSACIIDSIHKVTEKKIDLPLLKPTLELVESSDYINLPIIKIYYNIYMAITFDNEIAFEVFSENIKKYEMLFEKKALNKLFRLAINFCIKRHNQNRIEYSKHAFNLYLYGIENGILIENEEISRFVYTNIVTMGIKIQEFEKVKNFMDKYVNYIQSDYKENTFHFNSAKLFYATKRYNDATFILMTNEFKDIIWNLNAKYLLLKIQFETDDLETMENYFTAYRLFVKRRKNIGYHKEYFTNICNSFAKLMEIKHNPAKFTSFTFDNQTPDIDWFQKSLESIKINFQTQNSRRK